MAFEFGTNWSRLSEATGPVQGPLLAYESFTAFALEASFFGVLLFGRGRASRRNYFIATVMVALGTTFSAFWIMVNNSWMQAPVGYSMMDGAFVPTDWPAIIFSPVVWVRFPHMLVAAYLTGAFCVAATGAWYRLRGTYAAESRVMLRMGLFLAALLIPVQLLLGHLNGDYVHDRQPAKFAAIEARWHDEQPAAEVLLAFPDESAETNLFELKIPYLGSLVAAMRLNSKEVGLTDFPVDQRPPVLIPFFAFRIMVVCGLLMTALAGLGSLAELNAKLDENRPLLWAIFLSFVLPFVATLTGWFTAEVGRQPWTVYSLLRTRDAVTPNLTVAETATTLVFFGLIYTLIFSFGTVFIYRLLRAGPQAPPATPTNPSGHWRSQAAARPLNLGQRKRRDDLVLGRRPRSGHAALRDAGWLRPGRGHIVRLHLGRAAAVTDAWRDRAAVDGNETWLILAGTVLFGAFPKVYAALLSAFYLPVILMLGALILRGVAFEFRYKATRTRWLWDLGFFGGSVVASFVQGTAIGAMAKGLPFVNGHYSGGSFGWLSWFACLCGLALCFGYALLGASWLVSKCEGPLRDKAYALLPALTWSVLVCWRPPLSSRFPRISRSYGAG